MTPRFFLILAAVLGGAGVVFGAFGAHALEGMLANSELAPAESKPIRAIPLLLSTLRAAIARLFRRLFGSSNS